MIQIIQIVQISENCMKGKNKGGGKMLKVSHLTKVYKSKGGEVRALDDVSIEFPERGMVFLLGKSGSGKSTLLNVCGGLDSPTSGEIVVKGRSSRDFSQSDFDSYRNTFIGFVFQEYNILNEFTVEDNIALALELQGKPKDREAVTAILRQVDLEGFAGRRPNTLSGGQKQRIAIARALIKNPEIIMADEPTGALDSATGKQVLDTLKRLSAEKLVIVVSHDREFAEQYADRIVELKDGKIISDVTRTSEKGRLLGENVTQTEDALCIRRGAQLSEADLAHIRAFLADGDGDAIIVRGDGVSPCKKAAKITDDGDREVFTKTKESADERSYSPEEGKFIRSRLPARRALRIGASGLKTKPFRLFFTILLSVISFAMFGMLSTMTLYSESATFRKTLADSGRTSFSLGKEYRQLQTTYFGPNEFYAYDIYNETRLTKEEVTALGEKVGSKAVGIRIPDDGLSAENLHFASGKSSLYYVSRFSGFTSAEDIKILPVLAGKLPEEGKKEIALTSYAADTLLFYGLLDPDSESASPYPLSSRDDLIGKKLKIGEDVYTISGIANGGELPSEFSSLRSEERAHEENAYRQAQLLQAELKKGLYSLLIFDNQTTAALEKALFRPERNKQTITMNARTISDVEELWQVVSANSDTSNVPLFFEEGKTRLSRKENRGEILVSDALFRNLFFKACEKKEAELEGERFEEFDDDLYAVRPENDNLSAYELFIGLFGGTTNSEEPGLTEVQKQKALQLLVSFMDKWDFSFSVRLAKETVVADICGFIPRNPLVSGYDACLDDESYQIALTYLRTQADFTETTTRYTFPENAVYSAAIVLYDGSDQMAGAIYRTIDHLAENDGIYRLNGPVQEALLQVNSLVESLSEIFLWVGLILAVFSALLLSNFISVSISNKKKEIGILRAVGARSTDVFKIFFSESLIISVVCILLSSLGSIAACALINNELNAILSGVSVFVFGPVSFLVLAAVALGTATIATLLPVWNAAKKKPVESIRAL